MCDCSESGQFEGAAVPSLIGGRDFAGALTFSGMDVPIGKIPSALHAMATVSNVLACAGAVELPGQPIQCTAGASNG